MVTHAITIPNYFGVFSGLRFIDVVTPPIKTDENDWRIAEKNMNIATAVDLIYGGTTVYNIDIAGPLHPFAKVYSRRRPTTETIKLSCYR